MMHPLAGAEGVADGYCEDQFDLHLEPNEEKLRDLKRGNQKLLTK